MEKMVEVERATQEELRQDLKSLFQGAIHPRPAIRQGGAER